MGSERSRTKTHEMTIYSSTIRQVKLGPIPRRIGISLLLRQPTLFFMFSLRATLMGHLMITG